MRTYVLLPLALAACAATARPVPVEKWVQTTRSDFENGEAKGTAVLSLGQVVLAPELEPLLEQRVPHLMALAADGRGALYAAAGLPPRLLRLREGKAAELFAPPGQADLELLAVAVGPDGAVYTSAAPSGTLFRIGPAGKSEVLYKCPDPYIWALAVAPDGTVYAGTGPNGKLLKISPRGKASVVLQANASHILSLARADDGTLYAGTDKHGFLYEVAPDGEARLAYDAEESDIRAIALAPEGQVYFATAALRTPSQKSSSASAARAAAMRSRTTSGGSSSNPQPTKPTAPGAEVSAENAIYRLAPDGDVRKVASQKGVLFYALAWHQGTLYAGTGNEGKLYRLDGSHLVQLADLEESQVMALAVAGGALHLATANTGQVHRVAAPHAPRATFLSEVYDSGSMARWGHIQWQAQVPRGTSLTLATRSGNSSRPDVSWSRWSAEYGRPQGQAVASPNARFVQYRATLETSRPGATAVLDEVVIAYLAANRAPTFEEVKIGKPPKPRRPTTQRKPGQRPTPRPKPTRPLTTAKQPATSQRGPFAERIRILWKASDPNKDDLFFAVYFRGEDETTWKKIEDRLTLNYYDWDTRAVPDGPFRLRIVASDARTNPPAQARQKAHVTETFIIDNTPPTVAELAVRLGEDRAATVTARCSDAGSGLAAAEYAIDGLEWVNVAAADGIFDSNTETLSFKTPPLEPGEHTIVVRAKDEAENPGAAKSVFHVE
ncbi:MAG: SMP-30/gluconolactonase/LRE family protein [Candidatus Brocadiia bacterium]